MALPQGLNSFLKLIIRMQPKEILFRCLSIRYFSRSFTFFGPFLAGTLEAEEATAGTEGRYSVAIPKLFT